jgi:hypothetical protein
LPPRVKEMFCKRSSGGAMGNSQQTPINQS